MIKKFLLKVFIPAVFIVICGSLFCTRILADEQKRLLSKEEVLALALLVPEAQAFYALLEPLGGCAANSVELPCDSNWVTCIDDAWVVKFFVKQECNIAHDGRLSVTLLIDAKSGKIISRFPEVNYFNDPGYCLEDYDCQLYQKIKEDAGQCMNFIRGPVFTQEPPSQGCVCRKGVCEKPQEN